MAGEFTAFLKAKTQEGLDRFASQIEGELKAACPVDSGEARRSIHIEKVSETGRFIGGTNLHLFFADQGNAQRRSTIYPKKARALHFKDGTYHAYASTYQGKHFVAAVANRHR